MNTNETKIMIFRRRGGDETDGYKSGKKTIIEEVKEFKYLGYVLQQNGGQKAHIKDRVVTVMRQVWGIGKKRYGGDWGRRLWLFNNIVWTVLSYKVEI